MVEEVKGAIERELDLRYLNPFEMCFDDFNWVLTIGGFEAVGRKLEKLREMFSEAKALIRVPESTQVKWFYFNEIYLSNFALAMDLRDQFPEPYYVKIINIKIPGEFSRETRERAEMFLKDVFRYLIVKLERIR